MTASRLQNRRIHYMLKLRQAFTGLVQGDVVYVQIRRDALRLRDVRTGKEVSDAPLMAVSRNSPRTVLAVGRTAEEEAALRRVPFEVLNGFSHPRLVIGDFAIAEKTLQYFLQQLLQPALLRAAPVLVLHPLEKFEGGLSELEVRALQELGAGAGARQVHVWGGHELQDHELKRQSFKRQDGLLEISNSWKGGRSNKARGRAR